VTYSFGTTSRKRLAMCHPTLIKLAEVAIRDFDFSVVCGHRNKHDQTAAFESGHSKAEWGQSPHNLLPSRAMDLVPWPSQYSNKLLQSRLGHYMLGVAAALEIRIKWGGDFKTFYDAPHFELLEEIEDGVF